MKKYLAQQMFSASGLPPDDLKPDLGSRAAAEVEATLFTKRKRIDTMLDKLWSLPWSKPAFIIHTGEIYQAYAAWYNYRHPTQKISWRRLNRTQRKEAMQRWWKQ